MIAGIFGMNFEHMPATSHVAFYPACISRGDLRGVAVFRHHRWL